MDYSIYVVDTETTMHYNVRHESEAHRAIEASNTGKRGVGLRDLQGHGNRQGGAEPLHGRQSRVIRCQH